MNQDNMLAGWQPIDTAPKDPDGPMHPVLLGFEDTGDGGWPTCQGYWSKMLNDWVVASPFHPEYLHLSGMTDYKPTHWMPMPGKPMAPAAKFDRNGNTMTKTGVTPEWVSEEK